jgi:putative tryptophan/tyrosine transport system substrate-binding protein
MKHILGFLAVFVSLEIYGETAHAQQPAKIPRLGCYISGATKFGPREEAFRQGLRDLGYVEGKTIFTEWRFAAAQADRATAMLEELLRLDPNIIVTDGNRSTSAAKKATKTIPIVMAVSGDPVGAGLVKTLARPGGNITGLTLLSPELSGKRLELLKETLPHISRVAVLFNPSNPGADLYLKEVEVAAKFLGLQLQTLKASRPPELTSALSGAITGGAHALITLPDAMIFSSRLQVTNFAAENRLPAMFPESEFVNDGGLISYGPNLPDLFRRAAIFVDKILKGAKPAELPIEQPTNFELVVNLKTAKQIGLTIPPQVLGRADKVIK